MLFRHRLTLDRLDPNLSKKRRRGGDEIKVSQRLRHGGLHPVLDEPGAKPKVAATAPHGHGPEQAVSVMHFDAGTADHTVGARDHVSFGKCELDPSDGSSDTSSSVRTRPLVVLPGGDQLNGAGLLAVTDPSSSLSEERTHRFRVLRS